MICECGHNAVGKDHDYGGKCQAKGCLCEAAEYQVNPPQWCRRCKGTTQVSDGMCLYCRDTKKIVKITLILIGLGLLAVFLTVLLWKNG